MRTLTLAAIAVVFSQAPPPGGGPWPPNGVYPSSLVDTPPKLVQRVDAKYTAAAVRARSEGLVHLLCVVKADGTVGEVRVATSLDATNGLDAAAVAAVKQWQFSPAIKNGRPVPVSVAVEVGFTLRGMPRTTTWPDGFAPTTAAAAPVPWQSELFEANGLRIEVAIPPGWTLQSRPANAALATLRKNGTLSTYSVMRPRPAAESLDRPMTPVELAQAAENVEQSFGGQMMGTESVASGQADAAGLKWVWHAYKMATVVAPGADPKIAPVARQLFESVRDWTFDATTGGQAVQIICFAVVPRSGTDQEKTSWIADQAAAFGDILRRMKISVAP